MERQTILERLGWKFLRIRGSEYYSDKDKTMDHVVAVLEENGIYPESSDVKEREDYPELIETVKKRANEILDDEKQEDEQDEDEIETISFALEKTTSKAFEQEKSNIVSRNEDRKTQEEQFVQMDLFGFINK